MRLMLFKVPNCAGAHVWQWASSALSKHPTKSHTWSWTALFVTRIPCARVCPFQCLLFRHSHIFGSAGHTFFSRSAFSVPQDRRPRTVAWKDLQKVVGPWLHCLYQDVDTPLGILFSVDPGAFCDCIDDGPGLFGLLRG